MCSTILQYSCENKLLITNHNDMGGFQNHNVEWKEKVETQRMYNVSVCG